MHPGDGRLVSAPLRAIQRRLQQFTCHLIDAPRVPQAKIENALHLVITETRRTHTSGAHTILHVCPGLRLGKGDKGQTKMVRDTVKQRPELIELVRIIGIHHQQDFNRQTGAGSQHQG